MIYHNQIIKSSREITYLLYYILNSFSSINIKNKNKNNNQLLIIIIFTLFILIKKLSNLNINTLYFNLI